MVYSFLRKGRHKLSIMAKKIQTFSHRTERIIIYTLVVMMSFVLVLTTIELAYHIVISVITPPILLLDFGQTLDLFGVFLLVLIGIELLDTIKVYFKRNVVHVEVVVLVAIIAIARKVIVLEPEKYEPGTLLGIAAILLSLSVSYFLIKKLGSEIIKIKKLPEDSRKVIKEKIKETRNEVLDDDIKLDISGDPDHQENSDDEKGQ